ncbi:hypothetical protein QQF64_023842 [Cirrhinus molitorella]|uniref:Uncharacterized protein n=1 Tax=Cirrhinus molitorella TaxID=172907 RepID=A0ABR3NJM2_9TELE
MILLTNSLLAGPQVVGEKLTKILLLCDFYQRNHCLPVEYLKVSDHPIGSLEDRQTEVEFCQEVCQRNALRYPHTFARAVWMVTSMSYNSVGCLELQKPSKVPSAAAACAVAYCVPKLRSWICRSHLTSRSTVSCVALSTGHLKHKTQGRRKCCR